MHPLPPDAASAIARGHLVDAIRIVRDRTGLGLKESKDAVDRHMAGDLLPLHAAPGAPPPEAGPGDEFGATLPEAARAALARGDKIVAVKLVRDATGAGLAQAKEIVEAYAEGRPVAALGKAEARLDDLVHDAMAEPGRVNASRWGSPGLWLVIALVAGLAWLYLNGSL